MLTYCSDEGLPCKEICRHNYYYAHAPDVGHMQHDGRGHMLHERLTDVSMSSTLVSYYQGSAKAV
jgi:hypothetical protein